LLKCFSPERD